jgi:hypothetical protein
MNAETLLAEHPAIREAVAFLELHLDADLLTDITTAVCKGMTLDEFVRELTELIDGLVVEGCANPAQLRKARAQLQTPAFRSYLTGRLGVV